MILLIPVPKPYQAKITQRYGENPALYPTTHGHNGLDYGIPEDTQILAAAAGQVIGAGIDAATAAVKALTDIVYNNPTQLATLYVIKT